MSKTKRDEMYNTYMQLRAEIKKKEKPNKREASLYKRGLPSKNTPLFMVPTRDLSLGEWMESNKAWEKANKMAKRRLHKKDKLVDLLDVAREKFQRYEDLENKMVIKSLVRQKTDRELPNVAQNIYKMYTEYNNPS